MTPSPFAEGIRLDWNGHDGRYSVVDPAGTGEEAELVLRREASRVTLVHTGVPADFQGRGVGLALVRRAVDDARAQGWKLVPECPFARAQFNRHPEWADVLAS